MKLSKVPMSWKNKQDFTSVICAYDNQLFAWHSLHYFGHSVLSFESLIWIQKQLDLKQSLDAWKNMMSCVYLNLLSWYVFQSLTILALGKSGSRLMIPIEPRQNWLTYIGICIEPHVGIMKTHIFGLGKPGRPFEEAWQYFGGGAMACQPGFAKQHARLPKNAHEVL